jgi:hypothetical protein
MIWIWVYRILLAWLGGGLIAFLAALYVDLVRGEEVGVAYVMLNRKGALLMVLAWPWAFVLVMMEYVRAGDGE